MVNKIFMYIKNRIQYRIDAQEINFYKKSVTFIFSPSTIKCITFLHPSSGNHTIMKPVQDNPKAINYSSSAIYWRICCDYNRFYAENCRFITRNIFLVGRTRHIADYFNIPHIILNNDLNSDGECDEENA